MVGVVHVGHAVGHSDPHWNWQVAWAGYGICEICEHYKKLNLRLVNPVDCGLDTVNFGLDSVNFLA